MMEEVGIGRQDKPSLVAPRQLLKTNRRFMVFAPAGALMALLALVVSLLPLQ
jgi:hypothetical protein